MESQLFSSLAEIGTAGIALLMFYKIVDNMMKSHSQQRKEDGDMWRKEIAKNSENTNAVLKELSGAIKDINRHNAQH